MPIYRISRLGAALYVEADNPLTDAEIKRFKSCAKDAGNACRNPYIADIVNDAISRFNEQSPTRLSLAGRPWEKTIDI